MGEIHMVHGSCGCGSGDHKGRHHKGSHCCCGFERRFISREERRAALEEYREQLKKELQGVEEHLEDLGS